MDFGIARAIADSSETQAHTAGIVGTAQYFSPEQARGEVVDSRTDLYSMGVLLYEMLAGRPPFKGDTAVSVAYQHVSEKAPPRATSQIINPTSVTATPEPTPHSNLGEGSSLVTRSRTVIVVVGSPEAYSIPISLKKSSALTESITSVGIACCSETTVVFGVNPVLGKDSPRTAASRCSRNSSAV